jgi:hypothetical protein
MHFSPSRMVNSDHRCTIRGTAAASLFAFVREEFGEASFDRVASALETGHRGALLMDLLMTDAPDDRIVLPARLVVEVIQRTGDLYYADSGGPDALAGKIGAFAAGEDQPLMRRLSLDAVRPEELLRNASRLWRGYSSCGILTPTEVGADTFLLTLEGFHDAHRLWCRCFTGYLREVARRTSGRQSRITEVQCAAEGAPVCEWHGDWNGASLF